MKSPGFLTLALIACVLAPGTVTAKSGAPLPATLASDDFPGAEDPNSAFDKIIRHELPAARVYEDADVLIFLSNKPFVPGHALVISKTSHARSLIAIPPDALAKMMAAARRVMIAQRRVLGATGALIISANGTEQTVPHLHIHVIPTKPSDRAVTVLAGHADMSEADLNALAARLSAAMPAAN
jgi:histidine triad (HIT) family protein